MWEERELAGEQLRQLLAPVLRRAEDEDGVPGPQRLEAEHRQMVVVPGDRRARQPSHPSQVGVEEVAPDLHRLRQGHRPEVGAVEVGVEPAGEQVKVGQGRAHPDDLHAVAEAGAPRQRPLPETSAADETHHNGTLTTDVLSRRMTYWGHAGM